MKLLAISTLLLAFLLSSVLAAPDSPRSGDVLFKVLDDNSVLESISGGFNINQEDNSVKEKRGAKPKKKNKWKCFMSVSTSLRSWYC
ncbi:hypothetical protein L596_030625 [Steinernema carpocapsae]|uniref:Somatostatin/Cortistatin C-terminal domain-containing protein n=1 Tax=Steinernema carpocapsae TaxID=34508 RepID=A0A4V5ZX06_STECR|nr:hypothetical protein L596_030625 [Steinernema carpocapsae]